MKGLGRTRSERERGGGGGWRERWPLQTVHQVPTAVKTTQTGPRRTATWPSTQHTTPRPPQSVASRPRPQTHVLTTYPESSTQHRIAQEPKTRASSVQIMPMYNIIPTIITRTPMSVRVLPHNTPSSHLIPNHRSLPTIRPTHSAGVAPDGSCSIAICSSGSSQLSSTVARTLRTYSFIFSLYSCAASAFAGLFGFGSCSRDWIDVRIAATSYVGDQRFWRMSRHSSPLAYTFGWNIRDKNLTVGGLLGYDSSNVSRSLKVPSSNGVSAEACETLPLTPLEPRPPAGIHSEGNIPGPKMTAFQSIILSGHGLPEMPPGGSVESRLKSRIRRRRQLVDCRHF